ncbi:MAG: ABC transporter permease [Clostridiaceae bacterium]|nr:ABC transporter permease [Clostridiaceae bacterium]
MNDTLRYIMTKIFLAIPILIGITLLAFGLGLIARGDPALARLTVDPDYIPTEEEVQALREEMGLTDPIFIQYGRWISGVVKGDLGESYLDDKPVLSEMLRLLPNTLLLSFMSLTLIVVLGLLGGILLVVFQDRLFDVIGRILSIFIMSVPGFCLAYFMIWVFAQKLKLLPTSGTEPMTAFIMPCLALALSSACLVARLLRSSILGELVQDYALTARAKGLRKSQLVFRHTLRNALTPSVTHIANVFGGFLGGSMITESIFSIPGIGTYALTAINNRDYTAIQGYVLFTGFAFVLVCLLSDLICSYLNPQIRLGRRV